jgi:hypothetical protein
MKNLLTTILKTNEERIKNPFIGAFISSWIIINWKPIFFLIFASRDIESKIIFIEKNYSQITFILIYPALVALFYIIILPYLNILFDEILKYSVLKKNAAMIVKRKKNIQDEKEVAIEEIKLEEAKTEFRERNTHNKLVDNLQQQIKKQNEEFAKSKESYQNNIEELKKELFQKEQAMDKELKNLRERLETTLQEKYQLHDEALSRGNEINKLTTELEMVRNDNGQDIIFDDGVSIQRKNVNGHNLYFDNENGRIYSEDDIKEKMEKNGYSRIKSR